MKEKIIKKNLIGALKKVTHSPVFWFYGTTPAALILTFYWVLSEATRGWATASLGYALLMIIFMLFSEERSWIRR